MKAKIIIFCVLILCSQYLIADEATFFWNIGNINNELNIYQEKCSYMFSAQLINYYIGYDTKIFLELSPLKYWFFSENETKKMTFFNSSIFFNLLNTEFYSNLFGPIVSLNWLENENFNNFKIENYIFSIGIKFTILPILGLRGGTFRHPNYMFSLIEFESGYRNINGRHNIYIGIKIEPSILLVGYILFGMAKSGQLM